MKERTKTYKEEKNLLSLPKRPVSLLLRFHSALTARLATHSNVESPIKRLKMPNSTSREPAPAVQVSLMLSGGTPVFRFTCVWGTKAVTAVEWHFSRHALKYIFTYMRNGHCNDYRPVKFPLVLCREHCDSPWGKECRCWCSQKLAVSGQPSRGPSTAARYRSLRGSLCQRGVWGLSAECELRWDFPRSFKEKRNIRWILHTETALLGV